MRSCIYSLANGVNPKTNEYLEDESVFNDPYVIRNLFKTVELIDYIVLNRKDAKRTKASLDVFHLTEEQKKQVVVFNSPVSITKLVSRINEVIDQDVMSKLTYKPIVSWLIENNYLEEVAEEGLKYKKPLGNGIKLGITTELRKLEGRQPYIATLYSKGAQQFIVNHLEQILQGESLEETEGIINADNSYHKDQSVEVEETIIKDNVETKILNANSNATQEKNLSYLKHYKNTRETNKKIIEAAAADSTPKYGYNRLDGSPYAKPTPTMRYREDYKYRGRKD